MSLDVTALLSFGCSKILKYNEEIGAVVSNASFSATESLFSPFSFFLLINSCDIFKGSEIDLKLKFPFSSLQFITYRICADFY